MFSSAGVANFGHNNRFIKERLIQYINSDGPVHALDYFTTTKSDFIEKFEYLILPSELKGKYHYYFSPPSGTLAIEAAVKYARCATERHELACFTNAFHGLSYNALSATGNRAKRKAGYVNLQSVVRLPYDGYFSHPVDYLQLYEQLLSDESSDCDVPAALLLETIQAEGGLNCCSPQWYEAVIDMCTQRGIVSIVDDIQIGCGRVGKFFSFGTLSKISRT